MKTLCRLYLNLSVSFQLKTVAEYCFVVHFIININIKIYSTQNLLHVSIKILNPMPKLPVMEVVKNIERKYFCGTPNLSPDPTATCQQFLVKMCVVKFIFYRTSGSDYSLPVIISTMLRNSF